MTYTITRLLILECRGILLMMISMCLMEELSQFAGLPLRPSLINNTPQPVMCGATAVYSMRYGASDTNLLRQLKLERYVPCETNAHICHTGFVNTDPKLGEYRLSSPSSSWLPQTDLQTHDRHMVNQVFCDVLSILFVYLLGIQMHPADLSQGMC